MVDVETRDLIVAWTVAGLVAAPIFFFVGTSTVESAIALADPCTEWDTGERSAVGLTDECPAVHGRSETRLEHIVSRAAFNGMQALGAVAGLVAVFRRAAVHAAVGAAALLFVAAPMLLGPIGLIPVLFALMLLLLAGWIHRREPPQPEEATVAVAFLAALGLLAVLVVVVVLRLTPTPAFAIAFGIAALFGGLAVRRYWPRPTTTQLPP